MKRNIFMKFRDKSHDVKWLEGINVMQNMFSKVCISFSSVNHTKQMQLHRVFPKNQHSPPPGLSSISEIFTHIPIKKLYWNNDKTGERPKRINPNRSQGLCSFGRSQNHLIIQYQYSSKNYSRFGRYENVILKRLTLRLICLV